MKRSLIIIALTGMVFTACQKNSVTGRKQLTLVPESQIEQMSAVEYKNFLTTAKVVSSAGNKDAEMVKRVGQRIATALTNYLNEQGKGDVVKDYKWEFNLVDDPKQVNAWCMPGGKVVVYTGLLPVAQNEAGLAVVMGHEISHAVAKHASERVSQGLLANGFGVVGDIATQGKTINGVFNTVYNIGGTVTLLKFSRNQEYEADQYGLIFMARAGYNPNEAIPFWERMSANKNGQEPPEFLSTHPNDGNRIKRLKEMMPLAMENYKPIKN